MFRLGLTLRIVFIVVIYYFIVFIIIITIIIIIIIVVVVVVVVVSCFVAVNDHICAVCLHNVISHLQTVP